MAMHISNYAGHAYTIKFAGILRRIRPGIVLAPSLVENQHPDHAKLGRILRDAARLARYGGLKELRKSPQHAIGQLFYYAVTPEAEPRDISPVLVDISVPEIVAAWTAAMAAHASQVRARNYIELQLARARFNGSRAGIGHAIALFPNDSLVLSGHCRRRTAVREDFDMATFRPLKIGITCYPTVGGSGILATSLGEELARRGHEVHFISYERPFRLLFKCSAAAFSIRW